MLDELAGAHADRHSLGRGPLMEQGAWATVRDEVAEGRQAYVVCPLIEEAKLGGQRSGNVRSSASGE